MSSYFTFCKLYCHRLVELPCDPYDPEAELEHCNAIDSSLWEIKALHNHWYIRIADRSKFINGNPPEQRQKVISDNVGEAILEKLKTDNHALNPKFGLKVLKATEDLICD